MATNGKRGLAPKIRRLKTRNPGMSHSAIARKVGCRPSNVTGVLKTFLGKHTAEELKVFQENRAEVFDALQYRVLGSITEAKLAKAPAVSLITGAAILEDKARLVRGQATGINVNVLMDVMEAIRSKPSTINAVAPKSEGV